jgi:AraC-like DNA-binding protein
MKKVLQKPADRYEPRGRLDPAGFAQHVNFRTYLPPDDLVLFIEHCWIIQWDKTGDRPYYSEEVMHRPYVDVFFSAQEAGIQGTFRGKRIYVAAGAGRIIGIRFRPGAFHAFYRGPMTDLQDKIVDTRQVFPQTDSRYVEHLLALDDVSAIEALVELLRSSNPRSDSSIDLINEIITAIETDAELRSVAAVAERFSRSERWLQQLFQDYVGVGLKWLLQRHRLLTAAQQIRENETLDWAALAYDLGYSSQQHFINAFRQVVGKTPGQYRRDQTKQRKRPA